MGRYWAEDGPKNCEKRDTFGRAEAFLRKNNYFWPPGAKKKNKICKMCIFGPENATIEKFFLFALLFTFYFYFQNAMPIRCHPEKSLWPC